MASDLNLSGLASGIDTNSIVDKLMALERQPQTRIKLKQSQVDARKQALSDVAARLKLLKTAAADLRSPALWGSAQSVDASDSTKVAVTRKGGTGPGGYTLDVTQLATAAQRWYAYTPPAAADVLTIGGHNVSLGAGATIDAAASAINSDSAAPVYATVVTTPDNAKHLVLSARKTGLSSDFAASDTGGALSEEAGRAQPGLNAHFTVGTTSFDEESNVVTDAVPGLQITLKALTTASGPVTITVGAPAPDQSAITAKVKAFVDQYNSVLDLIRAKLDDKPVSNAATSADAAKGALHSDPLLTSVLSKMRVAITSAYGSDTMALIGISTGKSVGGDGLNQDAIKGKLTLDSDTLTAALQDDLPRVRTFLAGTGADDGFAQGFQTMLDPTIRAGGTLDQRVDSQAAERKRMADQLAAMDTRLKQKQDLLKRQFAAMESALSNSQSQGQWLQGQLNALSRSG